MALRIMIQRKVGEVFRDTDLYYEMADVFEILRARLREDLAVNEKTVKSMFGKETVKREYTIDDVDRSLERACQFFEKEFRFKTVSLS